MKLLFYYFLQVVICSGILYGYYFFFLRNKKFHQYNRYYLIAATVISILVPFLDIPVYFSAEEKNSSLFIETLTAISVGQDIPVFHSTASQQGFESILTPKNLILTFYVMIALIIFIRLIIGIFRIRLMINKYFVEKIDQIWFINTNEPGTPFSFFKWLFWNNKIDLNSENGQQIFRHELFHIEEKHSRDIVFLELLSVIFWLNPFFHVIKRELKAIHEFLADQFAVKENDKWNYAELLLMQVLQSPTHRLTNPFFHNQIQRRIAMITSSKKTSHIYLRKLMVLPIVGIVIGLFAFSYKQSVGERQGSVPQRSNVSSTDTIPLIASKKNIKDYLLVIDGIVQKQNDSGRLNQVPVDSIRTINILTGSAAITKYGVKAKNGVIEIFTKATSENKRIDIQKQNEYNLQQNKNVEKQNDIQKIQFENKNEVNSKNQQQINQKQDTKINGHNTDDDNKIFVKLEQEPTFPGGTPRLD